MEDVVSIYKVNFGPQLPHASSFINQTTTMDLQQKRKIYTVSYIHGLNVSPMNANIQMYNMWQPSLVLGRLGGALRVSMACKGPILALALQAF